MSQRQKFGGRPKADASDQMIGDQVRTRRLLIGMTQERLGDALGVSFQQVQKYEKGANRISASRLRQIATALDVPVTHFYDAADGLSNGHGDSSGVDGAGDPAREWENAELRHAFVQIEDPLVRGRVVDLVKALAKAH